MDTQTTFSATDVKPGADSAAKSKPTEATAGVTPDHPAFASVLVKGLAHKMNNILTVFHGYSTLLLCDENLPPETADGLTEIQKAAQAATELLDRTLAAVGRAGVTVEETDVVKALESLPEEVQSTGIENVRLSITGTEATAKVQGDPAGIRRALLELIRNASEAADGEATVTVAVEPGQLTDASGESRQAVVIRVVDDCGGIPEATLPTVFDPFVTTKKVYGCVGLGLPVVRGLASQFGGEVKLTSHAGQGTEVRILLPVSA